MAQPPCTVPTAFAAVLGADGFTHQHRAHRPLAAETQALQAARDQQLPERVGEAAQEGEESEPQDGELQNTRPPEAIGERARQPAPHGGDQQDSRPQQACLVPAHMPGRHQTGDDEAVDHHVHAVESPATERGEQSGAFGAGKLRQPGALSSRGWTGDR